MRIGWRSHRVSYLHKLPAPITAPYFFYSVGFVNNGIHYPWPYPCAFVKNRRIELASSSAQQIVIVVFVKVQTLSAIHLVHLSGLFAHETTINSLHHIQLLQSISNVTRKKITINSFLHIELHIIIIIIYICILYYLSLSIRAYISVCIRPPQETDNN